ncbi:VanZ family protein [Kitasatospora sp. CM 4170]|uniref:VanZ family protein n=1 Tax=Kitasatospora aburaviensis TaxID=67265 RepID=A0ABW1F1A7_9ACTN|nr:VanZ family protein [Kitasatospora sp. CM 4170]WNM46130.1 VanZ family protein [Kitasatospora sp. CM 4170]
MRTETRPTTGVHRPFRLAGLFALTVHLALAGWLVLRPLPVAWVYDANLTPMASLRFATAWQVLGELFLLAPLGLLLPLAGGRLHARWFPSFLRTTGASALLATALEFLASWTPGHVLDVDRILFAVVGVAATHLTIVPVSRSLLQRSAHRPRRARTAPSGPVGPAPASPAPAAPAAVYADPVSSPVR